MSALVELRGRIQSTHALIAQYERAVVEAGDGASPSLLANIRSLEKLNRRLESEYLEVASQFELEVYRYRIINQSDRVTLGEISEAWGRFQDFFSSVYSALTKTSAPGKKPVQAAGLELGYGYSFAGSVGVVVTVPKEVGIYAASPIDEASATVFDMIEAKNLDSIAKTVGPLPVRALHNWIDVHVRNHAGIGLEWRSNQEIKRVLSMDYQSLTKVQTTIVDATTTSVLNINGELFAVNSESKEFKIKGDNGVEFAGKFGSAITAEHAASVPARYSAKIVQTTKIILLGNAPETTFFLDDLSPI